MFEIVLAVYTSNAALRFGGVWGINQVENSHQLSG